MFGESESSLNSGLVIQTADLQSLCQLHFTHHLFVHPPPMVPAHLVASAQRLLWNFQHSPSRGPRTLILACRPIERRRSRVRCLHALESVEPDAVFRDTSTRGTLKSLNNRSHASTLPPLAVFQLCVKTVRGARVQRRGASRQSCHGGQRSRHWAAAGLAGARARTHTHTHTHTQECLMISLRPCVYMYVCIHDCQELTTRSTSLYTSARC